MFSEVHGVKTGSKRPQNGAAKTHGTCPKISYMLPICQISFKLTASRSEHISTVFHINVN